LEITDPAAAGFEFASVASPGNCSSEGGPPDVLTIHESEASTSDRGELATRFNLPDPDIWSARLEVESAVRDERGKFVANRSVAQFRGRDRFVGLRSERWTLEEGKSANIQYLVVDQNGKIATDAPVTLSILGQVVSAARVKGAGSAYLTSYEPEWRSDGSCNGSAAQGPQTCTFVPSHPGL